MTLNEFYRAAEGDYADALARLQMEALVVKILRMLPKDPSMAALTAAVEVGDAPAAFRAVHTLKGIALNLSLTALADAASALTEALRGRAELPEQTQELYRAVRQAYDRVCTALEQLEA